MATFALKSMALLAFTLSASAFPTPPVVLQNNITQRQVQPGFDYVVNFQGFADTTCARLTPSNQVLIHGPSSHCASWPEKHRFHSFEYNAAWNTGGSRNDYGKCWVSTYESADCSGEPLLQPFDAESLEPMYCRDFKDTPDGAQSADVKCDPLPTVVADDGADAGGVTPTEDGTAPSQTWYTVDDGSDGDDGSDADEDDDDDDEGDDDEDDDDDDDSSDDDGSSDDGDGTDDEDDDDQDGSDADDDDDDGTGSEDEPYPGDGTYSCSEGKCWKLVDDGSGP